MKNAGPITIVSGLPRSGTSLMMQLLDAGGIPVLADAIRAADDDNPKGYYEFEPVKKTKTDPSWLDQAPGKVVKMVHLLLYDLPADRSYHVVFVKRDLAEVVRSQRVMLDRRGQAGAKLPDEKLIAVFESQYRKIEAYLADRQNFHVLQVSYNDLMHDPSPEIDQLNAFLGGDLDTAAMRRVVDPALYRQRS
ncbi:MAG: sulfotransferase domain-containing protein [Phycisphaerales bacterium]|nr:sulfotransferase domain-containing protein [Phycisphaerales bacterium]